MDEIDEEIETGDQNREVLTESQFDKMMEQWKQQAADPDQEFGVDDLMDNWNKVWEKEQELMHQQFGMGAMNNPQIIFQ